jgi:hypothetical protein
VTITTAGADTSHFAAVNGNADTITIGAGYLTATGTTDSITINGTGAAYVHTGNGVGAPTSGADSFTFAGTNSSTQLIDGGFSGTVTYGVGNGSTVKFAATAAAAEVVSIYGDVGGTATAPNLTITGLSATLANDVLVIGNAATEATVSGSYTNNQVNVAGVTSLANALNLAVATAAASDSTGANKIAANTGLIDWFQFNGDTYIVEAVNNTSAAATHASLGANDVVIKVVGLVDLSSMAVSTLTINGTSHATIIA